MRNRNVDEEKEISAEVSAEEVFKIVEDPIGSINKYREFLKHTSVLLENIKTLYEQEPILFAMLGVEIDITVKSKLGTEIEGHLGSRLEECSNELQRETGI